MQLPWTLEELNAVLPAMKREIEQTEAESGCKPLLPMTVDEARDYLLRLFDKSGLPDSDRFLHGQLLSVFEQAVRAHTLGHKGRFFCISEEMLREQMKNAK